MAIESSNVGRTVFALVDYEDSYVQPLILSALEKRLPPSSLHIVSSFSELPSQSSSCLQFRQYESIDFDHLLQNPSNSLSNAYIIRKSLIRKHYLSTTVANWIVKYPASVLKEHVKTSVEFEVDYAEFLDDALVEAWELRASWERGGEWWILKPGMSERGQGIRLFSSEEDLITIFEGWDPESDDEGEYDELRSDGGRADGKTESDGIVTSQLRHFIAQLYIHPPLLLHPPTHTTSSEPEALRKFHIRTYVLAVGALTVYVYKPMLALFAAQPYTAPSSSIVSKEPDEALRAHLTNTCLQNTNDREGSVGLFWTLPDSVPAQPEIMDPSKTSSWKDSIFQQICAVTGEVFEAAARGMSIHFQPLPNAFEIFGLDYMVSVEATGELKAWLLEVNAFPDFRQTGDDLKGLVAGLFEGVVDKAIGPFFRLQEEVRRDEEDDSMIRVLNIDLGRR